MLCNILYYLPVHLLLYPWVSLGISTDVLFASRLAAMGSACPDWNDQCYRTDYEFLQTFVFFLEPSHMFTYLLAPLFYTLLSPNFEKYEKRISVFLTIGMILSTSGMGIVAVIMVWLLFIAKHGEQDNSFSLKKLIRPPNLLILTSLVLFFVVALVSTNFFIVP